MSSRSRLAVVFAITAGLACGTSTDIASNSRIVRVDGSSTVFPISAAVLHEFKTDYPAIRVAISISG